MEKTYLFSHHKTYWTNKIFSQRQLTRTQAVGLDIKTTLKVQSKFYAANELKIKKVKNVNNFFGFCHDNRDFLAGGAISALPGKNIQLTLTFSL